ncbi:MAG: response regulator transcription factor [Clostridiales bacterium]|nr:response regulator transcription factor [Clostridiales bacterium]MBQ3107698.1 response regulator transcription factor [Bacillota bacterium]
MFHILVAEDDPSARKLMEVVLRQEGYTVHTAKDGQEAMDLLDEQHVDLIVLDIMMPRMDGLTFTKELRDAGINTPILMVTARDLPADKRQGFLAGTDDYMTKPVDEEEMLLRIQALLRRSRSASSKEMHIGSVVLDYDALTVTRDGDSQTLPPKEFYLLYKLLSSPGKIFTRIQLMDEIWGMESDTTDYTINVHINRLRKRFEGWPEFEIQTVRGLGYKAVKKV